MSFEDSHQVFIDQMNYSLGKDFDKIAISRGRPHLGEEGYISVKKIANGNEEHEYNVITPRCYVYIEVDPPTNVVVGWRMEAPDPKNDCYINQ